MTKEALKEKTIQGLTFFGKLAMVIGSIAMLVVSAPLFLGVWLINFLKSFFSTFLFWIVGKGAVVFFTLMIFGGAAELNFISPNTAEGILSKVTDLLFTANGSEMERILPHFNIEITIIIILAIFIATKMTVSPDDF